MQTTVDSGIDWISHIPSQWSVARIASLFSFAKGPNAQKLTSEYIALNPGRYPVYSGQTSNGGVIGYYDQFDFSIDEGVILVTTVGAKAMTTRFIEGPFSLSQNCLIMIPRKLTANPKYFAYAVQPLFMKERSLIPDHMQPSMRMGDLSSYRIMLPDPDSQQKIVNYLNEETVKIDTLIEKQERLIELLEEKRLAYIVKVVSRGLNPSTELKDSNIQWLGEIPVGWSLYRAKYLFYKSQEKPRPDDEVVTAFRDGEVVLRNLRRTEGFTFADKEIGYQHVSKGDLVIHAMDGFAGAIGVSKSEGKMSPVCSICRPLDSDQVSTHYFAQLVRVMAKADWLTAIAKGIRERSTDFRWGDFANMEFPLPPYEEQVQIVEAINRENAKVEILRSKIDTQIRLLKERRVSLISNVVTGKVKV